MTDEQLAAIYKRANGEDVGKAQPITTARVFKAMRAMLAQPQQAEGWVPSTAMWHDRIKAAHPNSEPEYWPNSLKVEYMEQEIIDLRRLIAARPSAPTAVEPRDELMKFARRWEMLAYMHTRGVPFHVYDHYIGNPERLDYAATLHREYLAGELARASKGTS